MCISPNFFFAGFAFFFAVLEPEQPNIIFLGKCKNLALLAVFRHFPSFELPQNDSGTTSPNLQNS